MTTSTTTEEFSVALADEWVDDIDVVDVDITVLALHRSIATFAPIFVRVFICTFISSLSFIEVRSEVYNENDDDEHSLKWYRWGNFFTNYFKPPRGIGKFHHFRFTRVVFARETLDQPEKRLALLKESTNVPELLTTLPEVIQPAGLTEKRMRYLYNEVRPFFQYNFRDEFCPRASEE
ncbi:unnamed protein product [Mytilus edulis]|uniref:Uncharacterized protein n=1 Tax=Mytilus edulis TaxID=6550 RepID=A0A8S3RF92_MYTED|nr:unnamed protein product [Mytilus edulis]